MRGPETNADHRTDCSTYRLILSSCVLPVCGSDWEMVSEVQERKGGTQSALTETRYRMWLYKAQSVWVRRRWTERFFLQGHSHLCTSRILSEQSLASPLELGMTVVSLSSL